MVADVEGFSCGVCGADLCQDTVAVGSFDDRVAFRVMHRVAEYVGCEPIREADKLKDTVGSFGADGVGDSIG